MSMEIERDKDIMDAWKEEHTESGFVIGLGPGFRYDFLKPRKHSLSARKKKTSVGKRKRKP